jgi:GrpB-like predicted nucleotidyltransferase (UPF0157 family)
VNQKTLQQSVEEAVKEEIEIVPYNPEWPELFSIEKQYLLYKLPSVLIKRIEHFGSTSIPGLAAKPIIDILIEVTSLEETRKIIVPVLTAEGYEYFWRPINNDDNAPHYAWFIKRDSTGKRSHHIHMVEADSVLWKDLLFRDYLREFPEAAKQYEELKLILVKKFSKDRISYTEGKTLFVSEVIEKAREYYKRKSNYEK